MKNRESEIEIRDGIGAFIYCIVHSFEREKYVIHNLKMFNRRELPIYEILYKMINDETHIDHITVSFEMRNNGLERDYNYLMNKFKQSITVHQVDTLINVYYNTVCKTYIINLFQNAKNNQSILDAIEEYNNIQELTDLSIVDMKEAMLKLLSDDTQKSLTSGLSLFDDKISLSNGIVLITGKSGAGKTTLLREYLKRVLVNEHLKGANGRKISVQWNTMEDSIKMTMACFIANDIKCVANDIIKRKYTAEQRTQMEGLVNAFGMLDIEFQDKQIYINDLTNRWKAFLKRKQKSGTKFPILVIDNVMQLLDNGGANQTQVDDRIAQQISICRNEAKKIYGDGNYLIIFLHHLGKDQLARTNAKACYKPSPGDIKGSTRYQDISTIILFIHRFNDFKDIVHDFKDMKEYIKYIALIMCIKNREGGYCGEDHIWLDMDYQTAGNYELIPEDNVE